MRELRDPQNGCQIRKVPENVYTFPMDSLHKGATTIQSVGPLPPAEVIPSKVKIYNYNEYKTQLYFALDCDQICTNVYICIRIYKYTSQIHTYLFLKQQGKVPQYGYVCHTSPSKWVCFWNIGVPQNGSVSESLTHTSGHKLVKSTPRGNIPFYCPFSAPTLYYIGRPTSYFCTTSSM